MLQDIDGDGIFEFVIPTLIGEYHGDRRLATVPNIYQYRDHRRVDVSAAFAWYYASVLLPPLQDEFDDVSTTTHEPPLGESESLEMKRNRLTLELAEVKKRASAR